jgi:hypothetical protein
MAFKVKPFAEVIALSKEKLDEALAPIRARSAKAKADMAQAKLEEKMVTLEREIHEACAEKDLDFDSIISKIDQYELTERKNEQIKELITDLFPVRRR